MKTTGPGLALPACALLFAALAGCEKPADPAARCAALAAASPAGATITAAAAVTDREDLPGFCQVQGVIEPNIGFEARFPIAGWNGKYYQSGCGGYCGSVLPDKPGFSNTINEALKRGYAAITTDNGHKGGLGDASWAKGNPQAVDVYAHRGIALTHSAGTRMVEAFYETAPRREYFGGCSTGGRLAAIAAQRYPELFDGILGGGGVLHLSFSGGVFGSWVVQSNTDEDGRRILDRANFAAKLPALEKSILAHCDASDGERDNAISEPRRCAVDVGALPACDADRNDACFTAREKSVLAKWYEGPRNSAGEQLFPGMPAGGERFWLVWFLDSEQAVAPGNQLGGDFARFLGFPEGTPDDYTAMDFDFDRDPPRLAKSGELLDALDPDLTAFRNAGGKYLMWHGWADPLVLPDQSLDYYESVARQMGGYEAIRSFYRLFMIPGQGHCWEMPSDYPENFDPITALDDWVESGEAPQKILATAADPESAVYKRAALCPHPATAINLADGESFESVACGPD